jgi:hypothetical protein
MPQFASKAEELAADFMKTMRFDRRSKTYQSDVQLCNNVYQKCSEFLLDNRMLVPTGGNREIVGLESFNGEIDAASVDVNGINDLVEAAQVPEEMTDEAAKEVGILLAKFKACAGNDTLYRNQHFSHGSRDSLLTQSIASTASTVYAPSLQTMVSSIGIPSEEAFGANIDKVLPDIRASLAVTLLQFHRGLLDRVIHRRASASPYVKYVVPYAEVYDMLKSNDADHNVRDWGDHRIPFIELYGDPRAVSNVLQPIVPLKQNDTEDVVYADGYLRFNKEANLFDLSKLANELGKAHYNYTDLVSENVVFNSVLVQVAKGDVTELFEIPVANLPGSHLQMAPNASDSGDRQGIISYTGMFGANSQTQTGAISQIFADCTENDKIRFHLNAYALINLKRSDVQAGCNIAFTAYNVTNAPVDSTVAELADSITMTVVAYSIDAKYSEENLRKSNLAIRSHVRTFDFEISNGRNILVDYSMNEEMPEYLMSLVTEATSLGQDHRGIDVIIRELLHVYDVTREENTDPNFRRFNEKIGFQYVASQMVRPVVYMNTIDISKVDTIRSSDVLGDIRQYVEWQMMNLVSLLNQNSFYKHQLSAGESQVFKLFTSSVVLENLFNVPHIHNHLNKDEVPAANSGVEYRRVLPNGTILDCVTCTYNYMRDKIVVIPWRENNADDILNFGQNWDFGTFVAHYNPQLDNAVNKRVFSNTRSMVIPTNPMGLYLDVRGLDEFIDMFQVTNNTSSTLPQPSDLLAGE